ncbi:uncharacterized protein N7487_003961 [Penicillium crustosum]|uniref:uncharacterized protein n=1 Tax=Penicillium crustosum TaxID=36656 RepID=UPI00238CAFFF|nr:uncharacterized protein N7487_003961 [Penicillium crustosum]KAJ5409602.1 hypothetical protein N7487_003961 [Penicillium crustosum]
MAIIQASYVSKNDRLSQRSATDEFPTAKRRNWSEVAGSGIETPNLGPVDRTSILEHLISNVRLEMSERYSSVLEEYNIAKILEDSLSPADPETKKEAGIYLHILWREDETTKRFWLYVGQACVLCLRIEKHKDPRHRSKNMGLHYSVWGSAVDMKSAFVTLAILDPPSSTQTQLVLNLAEMLLVAKEHKRYVVG